MSSCFLECRCALTFRATVLHSTWYPLGIDSTSWTHWIHRMSFKNMLEPVLEIRHEENLAFCTKQLWHVQYHKFRLHLGRHLGVGETYITDLITYGNLEVFNVRFNNVAWIIELYGLPLPPYLTIVSESLSFIKTKGGAETKARGKTMR